MTECDHTCGTSAEFAGQGKGLVRTCVGCGAIVGATPEPRSDQTPTPRAAQPTRQARPVRQPSSKPIDVIKLARARLREVDRELKHLRALEAERSKLQRLLSAADGKPVAVVRELKTSSK